MGCCQASRECEQMHGSEESRLSVLDNATILLLDNNRRFRTTTIYYGSNVIQKACGLFVPKHTSNATAGRFPYSMR